MSPNLGTNKNLSCLLRKHFDKSISDTYATNLFPFIKKGGMSEKIRREDFVTAAQTFGLPQIEIVAPRLVIALGLYCFNGLRQALGHKRVQLLDQAVKEPMPYGGAMIWCQAHPSLQAQNTRNRLVPNQVSVDWQSMSEWFKPIN